MTFLALRELLKSQFLHEGDGRGLRFMLVPRTPLNVSLAQDRLRDERGCHPNMLHRRRESGGQGV